MFARGFARRTRLILAIAIVFILSGLGIVAGMILAPNETAAIFPLWIGGGVAIFASIMLTLAVLSYKDRREVARARKVPRQ